MGTETRPDVDDTLRRPHGAAEPWHRCMVGRRATESGRAFPYGDVPPCRGGRRTRVGTGTEPSLASSLLTSSLTRNAFRLFLDAPLT